MRLLRANLVQPFGFWRLNFGRRRGLLNPWLWLLTVSVLGGAACTDNPVGRQCFIPTSEADGGVPVTVVASPALECHSLTCLHVATKTPDLCTGDCNSDGDCQASAESPCQGGFVCMVPVVVGNSCCKKLCVCRDYLILPDGGMGPPTPSACDPTNEINECCNLEGRTSNPTKYPACQ